MIRKAVEFVIFWTFRAVLSLRYSLKVEGLDAINKATLPRDGGVLFLPNHVSVLIDPLVVGLAVWRRFPIRPMIVEYMYYTPLVHWLMKFVNAIPIPNFITASNSLKAKKTEMALKKVVEGLDKGDNFLIYPAGKVKLTPKEVIGGASGIHQVIQEANRANIVLVRVKGLWGSSFSAYCTGKAPNLFDPVLFGIKSCLKNLLFFTPRREITIQFVPAGNDFPYGASKQELNRYLERWYNQPDGLTPPAEDFPGDSLSLVSYSMWGEKYLPQQLPETTDVSAHAAPVGPEITKPVLAKLAELAQRPEDTITPTLNLTTDLGLDSLDIAELTAFLDEKFDVKGVPVNALTNVASLMSFAAAQQPELSKEEIDIDLANWNKPQTKRLLTLAAGETIPEVFFNNCDANYPQAACGDQLSGVLSYKQLKMRVLLLADTFRHLPGKHVGVLLPAGVAANITILALETAGKVPVMINWTVGPRHLESVIQQSKIEAILSSWAFLDKLENVSLSGAESLLIMLEDIRRDIGLLDKAKAYFRSKLGAKAILKIFKLQAQTKDTEAVMLFTSGTEGSPKGVPLSHENILFDIQAIINAVDIFSDDILYGILPPFHAFGFTVSALLPLLTGLKVASYPNPLEGAKLASGVKKWGITLICGAPTFLKGMLRVASREQMSTLRLCITGAERAPADLFQLFKEKAVHAELIEGYGITECAPVLTVNRPNQPHCGVGLPLPGIELAIVHPETFEELDVGAQGHILAHGPNIFTGYLSDNGTPPFALHKGKQWYKTGDLGHLNDAGQLTISGRQKRFVKIGGELISLSSIEEALIHEITEKTTSQIAEGPLLAVSAKELDTEKPKIFLFSKFEMSADEANQLLKNAGFSTLVRIYSTVKLDEIPLMGSGKINYRALEMPS